MSHVLWRTSSCSGGDGGGCVEVGTGSGGQVFVRDSKEREGPVLAVTGAAWQALPWQVKASRSPSTSR